MSDLIVSHPFCLQNLKRLPEVFPAYQSLLTELIQADLTPHATHPAAPQPEPGAADVPAAYLLRALAAYATASGPFRAWSLRHLTLQQAIAHLDPDRSGMQITVVRCSPAAPSLPIRSLCAWMRVGTAPWNAGISRCLRFLGAESLAGWAVGRGEPGVIQRPSCGPEALWIDASPQAAGAVAWPLQREGKLAGCLLAVSTQHDSFTSARLALMESYANVLALSFADQEFFELSRIALQDLSAGVQPDSSTALAQLRERVGAVRRQAASPLSETEAERIALAHLEAELLSEHEAPGRSMHS